MKTLDDIIDACRVSPGAKVRLSEYDPSWAGDTKIPKAERKQLAEKVLSEEVKELSLAQERLYAADTWSVLVILQAMDAAGKDGTIKHGMSGLNPQGCQVFSFKQPSAEELDHDFLWRCAKALPERGRIGIFNRSYYEEVLVVKVHPNYLAAQKLPNAEPKGSFWEKRYEDINNFERHLSRNGTRIVKIFLHISKEEQRQRFLDRVNDPSKHWKFSLSDLGERAHWDEYERAYEECLSATSTKCAPWHVIPANHKWVARALTASVMSRAIAELDVNYPEVPPEMQQKIAAAKQQLESEGPK